MSDPTPRQQIEEWAAAHAEGSPRGVAIVRAALEIIDAEHHEHVYLDGQGYNFCVCVDDPGTSPLPWPCPVKAEHEAKLWQAINGV